MIIIIVITGCLHYTQGNTQNNIFVQTRNIRSKLWGHFLLFKVIFSLTGHVGCCHLEMRPRIRFFDLSRFTTAASSS